MVRDEADDLRSNVEAIDGVDVQPVEYRYGWLNAGLLVIERSDAPVHDSGGRRLAEIVAKSAEHQGRQARAIEIAVQFARFVHHHERVRPDVTFRVPLRFLFAPDRREQFRHALPVDPRIRASRSPIEGRAACRRSFSISPHMRSAGRSSSGNARQSAAVWSSRANSKRA